MQGCANVVFQNICKMVQKKNKKKKKKAKKNQLSLTEITGSTNS